MKKFLTIASAMIAVATLYVTAQGITLDDVPYNTPMWSQQDPFGFDTMNVVTVDLSKIKGDIVVITNDMSNIKGTMAVVTNDIKGVKGTMAVVTNDVEVLKLYGPRITSLEAFTNTVDVASYVKKNEGNGIGSDFSLFGNTGTRSFSIGYHGFGVNQSYDDYDFESFSGPQGITFEKRSKTTWEEHMTWYKDDMIFMMYTSPSGTVGDGREYTLPEGPSSRIATLHDVVSATGGIVTVESDPVALPLLATHTNSAGIHLTPTQATRIANSVLGSEIPDYLRNLPAVTNWSFSASGANKSMSFNSQTGLLFSDEVANVSYFLDCFGLAMLSDNGGGSVSFKLDGIRVSDTLYGYPSGVASDIATKADIATAVAGLDLEEKDLKALRLYHYGNPDIVESPTNWFTFSGGVITGFNYQAGREHVVIPWEIDGQAVVEIGADVFIDTVETVIAPKSVLRLAKYAFAYNEDVVSVDFPAVTNAGYAALAYCKNLKHINLPSIVVVPELYRCAAKSLSFPSASRVTYNAINDCTNLVELTFGSAVKPTFDADWNTYGTHPDLKIYVTNPYATGWDGITEVDGTPVVRVVNTEMLADFIPGDPEIGNVVNSLVGPRIAVLEDGTNSWNLAFNWGNHASMGYLTAAALNGYATTSYVQIEVNKPRLASGIVTSPEPDYAWRMQSNDTINVMTVTPVTEPYYTQALTPMTAGNHNTRHLRLTIVENSTGIEGTIIFRGSAGASPWAGAVVLPNGNTDTAFGVYPWVTLDGTMTVTGISFNYSDYSGTLLSNLAGIGITGAIATKFIDLVGTGTQALIITTSTPTHVQGQVETGMGSVNLYVDGWLDQVDVVVDYSEVLDTTYDVGAFATTNYVDDALAGIDPEDKDPYQPWTSTIVPVNGTATVVRAHGLYPKLELSGKTVIAIDSDTYPTGGTSAVKLSLFAGANEVELNEENVMYAEPIEISDTEWTTIYFERTSTNTWRAVTW